MIRPFLALAALFAVLLALQPNAFAQTVPAQPSLADVVRTMGDLTNQVSALALTMQDSVKPETVSATSKAVRTEALEWGEMGANVGRAILATAKELGMAAADFSHTGLGKFVIALIAFKLIGKTLIWLAISLAFGITVLVMGFYWAHRLAFRYYSSVEYQITPIFWGMFTWRRVSKVEYENLDGDAYAVRYFGAFVILAGTLLVSSITLFHAI